MCFLGFLRGAICGRIFLAFCACYLWAHLSSALLTYWAQLATSTPIFIMLELATRLSSQCVFVLLLDSMIASSSGFATEVVVAGWS